MRDVILEEAWRDKAWSVQRSLPMVDVLLVRMDGLDVEAGTFLTTGRPYDLRSLAVATFGGCCQSRRAEVVARVLHLVDVSDSHV